MTLSLEEPDARVPDERDVHYHQNPAIPDENNDWRCNFLEHSRDLLCVHDLEGRLLSVNALPARILGYSVEELLTIPLREIVDPAYREQFDSYLRAIEHDGQSQGLLSLKTRLGERRLWEYHSQLYITESGTKLVRGIGHDVTERVHAEKALRASNEKLLQLTRQQDEVLQGLTLFRNLVNQSTDAIQVIDPATRRFVEVNKRACEMLGYSREELLSMTLADIDPEMDRCQCQKLAALGNGASITMERAHRRKDGSAFPVEMTLRSTRLDREYCIAVTRDISARKRAATLLQGSEKRFRVVYEKSPVGVCLIDTRTGRFLHANPKYCEITGRTEEDLQSRDFYSITHPDDLLANREIAVRLAKGETSSYDIDKRYVLPDGSIRWVNATAVSVLSGTQSPYCVAIVQDITESRAVREALQQGEANLKEAQRVAHMGSWRIDIATQIMTGSDEAYRIMGLNPIAGAVPLSSFERFFLPENWRRVMESYDRVLKTGEPKELELQFARQDGSPAWMLLRGAVQKDHTGNTTALHGILLDVTERRKAEHALRESEERLRLAQEAAQIGVFERNLVTGENRWSLQMETIYGVPPGACPTTLDEFLQLVHPDDRSLLSSRIAKSMESDEGKGEWRVIWPDGSVHWISGRWRNFKDAEGKPARSIGMDFDITERKQIEEALEQSEERFRVALKNSPITVFNQDRDLRYTWMYNAETPLSASANMGKNIHEVFEPAEAARIAKIRRQVLETGVGTCHEMQILDAGKRRYYSTTIEPVRDAAGTIIGLTGASMEITALREATEALRAAKERLAEEKLYLEQEINTELGFEEIIGQSRGLRDVMKLAVTVAASDATVLLLGETGTGKELVARAIHRMSKRSNTSFIKMNCAAIPSGLLESELFGSEKGAFTGAVNMKPGRVELADKGTLFLDEIGEIPLELQPKLLRVLQDHELERLGGTRTFKVDFRLIAATNRDLANGVRENEFRSDLYYRLNVFPIKIPPLRERREDIRLLVEYFVQKFARRMSKTITCIPAKTLDALRNWEWPGNIRELENFVERSVILTHGSVLVAPLSELISFQPGAVVPDDTLARAEREHILRALQQSHGQIGGVRGAAARLGLKRTTLQSKLKHLGISSHSGSREH